MAILTEIARAPYGNLKERPIGCWCNGCTQTSHQVFFCDREDGDDCDNFYGEGEGGREESCMLQCYASLLPKSFSAAFLCLFSCFSVFWFLLFISKLATSGLLNWLNHCYRFVLSSN